MKVYAALFGLAGFGIGLLEIFYGSELPAEIQLTSGESILLVGVSVLLMYYGKPYLLTWIGYSVSSDGDSD